MDLPIGQRPQRPHSKDSAGELEVQAVAQRVLSRGLDAGESAFTPSLRLWTADVAGRLDELLAQPVPNGKFLAKLDACVKEQRDETVQLAAELLYVCLLPVADQTGASKRQRLRAVLSWMDSPIGVPDDLDEVLQHGVFNGGMGYTVWLWANYRIVVSAVAAWTSRPDEERQQLLSDPFGFRDFIMSVPGAQQAAERHALPYLTFPDVFEPIVSTDHRKRIRQAFADRIGGPTDDLDRDLLAIREVLEAEAGHAAEFYHPPLREQWQPSSPAAAPAPVPAGRAWWVRQGRVQKGTVEVGAGALAEVPREDADLEALVQQQFPGLPDSQVMEQVRVWREFLRQVAPGDRVCTTRGESLLLGEVTGDPSVVADDRGVWLTRTVTWRADVDFVVDELPAALQARVTSGPELVDLTPERALLEELLRGEPGLGELLADPTDELAQELLVDRQWLQDCVDLLRDRPQMIFYGPPGTGKTWLAQRLAWHLAGKERTTLVQFHPSYSYEDFFEGYRPRLGAGGALAFELHAGPLRRAVDRAHREPDRPHFLVVDEINRGNLAKIFGELYFLLEYRDQNIELLYSREQDPAFTLPANLFLIGTMNTVDRSIALVDTAMRRRFSFVSLHPSVEPTRSLLARWLTAKGHPQTLAGLLGTLNGRLTDPDFKVGPSYFMRDAVQDDARLRLLWRTAILPLLEEHHYGSGVDVDKEYALTALLRAAAPPAGTPPVPDSAQDAPAAEPTADDGPAADDAAEG